MAGIKTNKKKLNHTLEKVCDILNNNDINDWFIFFGTLLGVVRENSCIKGDDDLDIMINHDRQKLGSIFEKNGFKFKPKNFGINDQKKLLKTLPSRIYTSVDFYLCDVNDKNYFSPWQNVEVQNVEIETIQWRDTQINIPNNSESLLEKIYGENWRTPIESDKIGGIYDKSFKKII